MEDMFGTGSLDTPESYRAPESYGTPRRSLRDILGIQGPDESDEPYTATQQLAEMRRPKLTDLILPIAALAMAAKSKGPAALGPIADYANKRRDYMSVLEEMAWKETQQQKVIDKENREKKYISTMKLPPELEQYRGVLDAETLRAIAENDLKYKAAPAEETPADKDARELAEYEARKKVDQRYKDPKEVKSTGWTDSQWDDYQRKLNMQASTLGTKEDIKGQKEREEAGAEAGMGMDKTVNLFKNLWDRKKEQLGTSGAGVLVGTGKQIAAKARVPGFESTAAFEGQRAETAMALNRIVTGQNRLVKSIYDRLLASLPDENDTESYARAKLEQSIRNAYGLQKAMRAYGNLTPEEMENIGGSINPDAVLTGEDEVAIQALMKQVFGESKGGAAKTPSSFPTVTTQEQYNKLKSGTQYREELNGPLFRKP